MSSSPQKEEQQPSTTNTTEKEEPEPECAWCKWMKGGGCKEQFEVWLKCVDGVREAGRDDVESCASVMGPLWDCMAENSDYYSPQLESVKQRSTDEEGQAKEEQDAKSASTKAES